MPYSFARSRELFARAGRTIAGGVNSGIRKLEQPVPLYFSHGQGSRLWDVDGNEYIDYQIGQGANLFGHAPPGLSAAIAQQALKGTHWAAQSALEIEVAERLHQMVPSAERVRFSNSATEAVSAAFRLARATTGKPLILRFEGHYHGWTDEGLVGFAPPPDRWGTAEAPARLHPSQGVIPEVLEHFVVARWNDPEHFRKIAAQYRGRIAAVVLEPILCNTCCIEPVPGLMTAIRELCDTEQALLIADETITGLRFGAGGAQAYLGLAADLTVLGKAVGGGVPFSVLAGRERAMDKITRGEVIHAGTLNGNPLCLAASAWCLQEVQSAGPGHPVRLNSLGGELMAALRQLADRFGVPLRPQGPGLVFHTVMLKPSVTEGPIRDYRDYVSRHDAARWAHLRLCLLEEGVRAIERGLWFVSLAHAGPDIAETVRRSEHAFRRHAETWKSA